jgi:hypothetical protein
MPTALLVAADEAVRSTSQLASGVTFRGGWSARMSASKVDDSDDSRILLVTASLAKQPKWQH